MEELKINSRDKFMMCLGMIPITLGITISILLFKEYLDLALIGNIVVVFVLVIMAIRYRRMI